MAEKKSKSVAKKEENALAEFSADELAEMEALGLDATAAMDADDLQMPQLALVQKMSRFVDEDDAKAGQFIDSISRVVYESPEFIVGAYRKTRVRFSDEIGGAPLCTSPNALDGYGDPGDELEARGPNGGGSCISCPHAVLDFNNGNIGDCALQHNFVGFVVPEDPDDLGSATPVSALLQRTSVKSAKQWNSMLKSAQMPWAFTYVLTAEQKKNDSGTFHVWKIRRGRKTTADEIRKAMEVARMMRDLGTKFAVDQARAGGEGGDADEADSDAF